MQKVCPLTYNDNIRHMFFEMRMNSDYKLLVTEEEIFIPPDAKPTTTLDPKHITILDADYVPPGIFIKDEPLEEHGETTNRTIGEIITQPDYIAKAIKQEILDSTKTAIDITHKHNSTCELNKYVEMQGGIDNLCIEDIRTLIQADQAVILEMIPVTTTANTQDTDTCKIAGITITHTKSPPSTDDALSVVTNSTPTTTAFTTLGAINAGTKMPISEVTSSLGKYMMPAAAIGTSLHMVTLPGPSSSIEAPTPTPKMTITPLHMVTVLTTSSNIGAVTASKIQTVSRSSTSENNKQLKWSRIFNRPIEPMPTPDVGEIDKELSQPNQSTTAETSSTNLTDKYYEVLFPSQDEVVRISHMDILNS